ncbi:MAG: hypothetical protein HQL10_10345 [Nitrospirae bacterium]|nr:hypothetical protein [Nitrospirota bacterium]
MTYAEALKDGFKTVHKNWQLALIQFLSMIVSFISFFIIVGTPIGIAFILFGLDLTEILKMSDVFSAFRDSAELLKKYFAMAIVIILSLLAYLSFIVVLWTFTFGGIIGVITDNIFDEKQRFSFKIFISDGKRYFFPVFIFSAVIGIIFIVISFVLVILGGISSSIIEIAKSEEVTFALFLGVFFSLILVSAGLFLILVTLAITVYGIATLAFKSTKSFETLKVTIKYLISTPSAIWFYGLLMAGYALVSLLFMLIGSPITFIPFIGPLLAVPYHLLMYLVQGYFGLITIASAFHYYHRTAFIAPVEKIDMPEHVEEV